jgi:phosphoglycolate phosphatase
VGFDLDMTLVDSATGIAATLRATLAELGRTVTDEQVWPFIGVPMETTVRTLFPDLDPSAVSDRYRALYPELGLDQVRLLPGAAEAFRAVHALDGRVLVVSAKVESSVHRVLARVGFDDSDAARAAGLTPDRVVGGLFAGAKGVVLREAGADVYVGDHGGDMEAARVAGCAAVGVATGPQSTEQLHAAGADVVLPDLTVFPAWLRARSEQRSA